MTADGRMFPDTEEVTGSSPVSPTGTAEVTGVRSPRKHAGTVDLCRARLVRAGLGEVPIVQGLNDRQVKVAHGPATGGDRHVSTRSDALVVRQPDEVAPSGR
jgi:hypothetical protein